MDTDPARREARLIVLRRSPERLEALKRAMAQFLGGVLSIRDAGVRTENGLVEPTLSPHKIVRRPSLAKLFLDRGGYLPSVQMLRDEYETQQLLNTIQSVRKIEFRLAHRSPDGVHVLSQPVAGTADGRHLAVAARQGKALLKAVVLGVRRQEHVDAVGRSVGQPKLDFAHRLNGV